VRVAVSRDGMADHKIIYTTKNTLPSPSPSVDLISSSPYSFSLNSLSSSLNSSSQDTAEESKSLEIESNTSVDNNPNPLKVTQERIITRREYFLFCFGFSLSVVPIVAVFTFAPVIFQRAGGIGNGVFCIGYTLCSLLYTKKIIQAIGCKAAILWGHFGSGIYMAYYLLCTSTVAFRYSNVLYPFGAFIGGISQSIMCVILFSVCLSLSLSFSLLNFVSLSLSLSLCVSLSLSLSLCLSLSLSPSLSLSLCLSLFVSLSLSLSLCLPLSLSLSLSPSTSPSLCLPLSLLILTLPQVDGPREILHPGLTVLHRFNELERDREVAS
jgi:hypothetical protein